MGTLGFFLWKRMYQYPKVTLGHSLMDKLKNIIHLDPMCNTKVYFSFRQIFKDIQIREYTFQPNTIPACKNIFRRASPVTMQKNSLIKSK